MLYLLSDSKSDQETQLPGTCHPFALCRHKERWEISVGFKCGILHFFSGHQLELVDPGPHVAGCGERTSESPAAVVLWKYPCPPSY